MPFEANNCGDDQSDVPVTESVDDVEDATALQTYKLLVPEGIVPVKLLPRSLLLKVPLLKVQVLVVLGLSVTVLDDLLYP